uniref:Uncharacterized protein n=1 Tax=Heterorhabditis bacteriophora TaxID=37862 RepID=A0A1I7W9W0_HETBA
MLYCTKFLILFDTSVKSYSADAKLLSNDIIFLSLFEQTDDDIIFNNLKI